MPKLVNVKLDLKVPGIGGVAGTWEPDESEVRRSLGAVCGNGDPDSTRWLFIPRGVPARISGLHLLVVRHHKRYLEGVWTHRGSAKERA